MRFICVVVMMHLSIVSSVFSDQPAKPTDRAHSESQTRHLARYTDDDFTSVTLLLGVEGSYSDDCDFAPGLLISAVGPGTAAEKGGLVKDDVILEVDGVPVGTYGSRTYYVWKRYPTGTSGSVQLTVAFEDDNGDYQYFYPVIKLDQKTGPTITKKYVARKPTSGVPPLR